MTQYKDPWADAANQAVGALYKYYLTQPSQADRLKAQNAQLDYSMNKRLYDMGGWSGAPAPIQNKLYRDSLGGDSAAAQIFDSYVNKPMQVDAGDTKYIVSGTTGLPVQEYGVGVAPEVHFDKDNSRFVPQPAVPSANRPQQPSPISDVVMNALVKQESNGDPNALSPKGAAGKFQIMPDTAREPGYGVQPLQGWDGVDPRTAPVDEQERFSREYLLAMTNEAGGDLAGGLARYNAGDGAVDRNGGRIPQNGETPQYVENVMGDISQRLAAGQPVDVGRPQADIDLENTKGFNLDRGQDDLNNTFASAIYNVNEGGAGLFSFRKDIPLFGGQTTAGALEADIAKLTSKAAIDEIARLKSESKTGGFFGNLSDGERQAVADSQAAIRQDLDPKELAYRIMVFQDMKNDIVHGRGKQLPSGEFVPLDFGAPRTGMPTVSDIQAARSPDEVKQMWDAFSKYPVFEGEPPPFIANALEQRYTELAQ